MIGTKRAGESIPYSPVKTSWYLIFTPWNGIFSFVSRKATFKQQNVLLLILSFVMPQKKFNLDIIQFK